jgi:hypothetical protein
MQCVPSYFNKFSQHLTLDQSRKIQDRKFGSLIQIFVELPETTDILVYLMDKLNPMSMILEVGDEGGLKINDLFVHKVLGIPRGRKDPPSSTEEENERALALFRRSVHVDPKMDAKCKDLLPLMSKLLINNDLAVRIFFVIAFNKLLFHAVDNNIREKDVFLTMDVSDFANVNWCKAVLDELRYSAIMWWSKKKKSISGCALFLIVSYSSTYLDHMLHIFILYQTLFFLLSVQIFYLDNLESRSAFEHITTPRAKFFSKIAMERIICEDKRKDRDERLTYGNLLVFDLFTFNFMIYYCTCLPYSCILAPPLLSYSSTEKFVLNSAHTLSHLFNVASMLNLHTPFKMFQ